MKFLKNYTYSGNYDRNLAYDFDMFDDNLAKEKKTAKIIKLKKRKINFERFRNKVLIFTSLVVASCLTALVASILIYGHLKSSEITSEITKTKKLLEEEMSRNISLKSKKESMAFSKQQNKTNDLKKIEYILNTAVDKAEIY